jgi:hypothetical protein
LHASEDLDLPAGRLARAVLAGRWAQRDVAQSFRRNVAEPFGDEPHHRAELRQLERLQCVPGRAGFHGGKHAITAFVAETTSTR